MSKYDNDRVSIALDELRARFSKFDIRRFTALLIFPNARDILSFIDSVVSITFAT